MLKNGGNPRKFTPKSGCCTETLISLIGFDIVKEPHDDGKSPSCRTAEIDTNRKSCSNC